MAGAVRDDGSVGALVVGDAHVAELLGVVSAVLEHVVHLHRGLGLLHQGRVVGGVVVGGVLTVLDDLHQHVHFVVVAAAAGDLLLAGGRGAAVAAVRLLGAAEHLLDGGVGVVRERRGGRGGVVLRRAVGRGQHAAQQQAAPHGRGVCGVCMYLVSG